MKITYLYTWAISAWLRQAVIALVIACSTPVNGASLSFIPTGSQLDSDSIQDLGVKVGDSFDINFFLDTTGLSANLQSIDIRVDQDLAESSLTAFRTNADITAFPNFTFSGSPQDNGLFSAVFRRSGDPGLTPDTTIEIVTGTLDILSGLNNDGVVDFAVTVVSAIDANDTDVTNLFQPSTQSLELQQPIPESTSVISLLTWGFLGVGSIVWNKKI